MDHYFLHLYITAGDNLPNKYPMHFYLLYVQCGVFANISFVVVGTHMEFQQLMHAHIFCQVR